MSVLIADPIDNICIKTLNQRYGIKTTYISDSTIATIKLFIANYDGLIVRGRTKVDREIIKLGVEGKLKVIGRAGMGLDNIDVEAAKEFGVKVFNVTDGHIQSVAEHTIGLMIALNRKIISAHNSTKTGKWEKTKFKGNELYGKTLGIVGYGQIGQRVAKIAAAMEIEIFIHDPYYSGSDDIISVSLQTMFKECDFVTLHVPLNSETENMINSVILKNSKCNLKIINTSRGKVIDEEALVYALQFGSISGAALDVFSEEPPHGSPLLNLDNVIVTPHIASSTIEAQERIAEKLADKIGLYLLNFKERCEHDRGKTEYCLPCGRINSIFI